MADTVSAKLLRWYDANARTLPWRLPPGAALRGDAAWPYRVWLSEVMLQQTTVAAVMPYFERFTARWPTVAALAAADDAEVMTAWAGLGYYARARNLLACARAVVSDHGGRFPAEEAALRALPGVGEYTAAAIAAIAFGRRAVVIDGNVERVVTRLFAIDVPLPGARPAIRAAVDTVTPAKRSGDFAQAMMDLGSGICQPRAPRCPECPLASDCRGRELGIAETLPVKAAKPLRPVRFGVALWIERGGDVLTVKREAKGLLGGMRALPTGEWGLDPQPAIPAVAGLTGAESWREVGEVRHVFTHFELRLRVMASVIPANAGTQEHRPMGGGGIGTIPPSVSTGSGVRRNDDDYWWPIADLRAAGFPTLFAKAARLALSPPLKAAA